jgi:hypothetical protein
MTDKPLIQLVVSLQRSSLFRARFGGRILYHSNSAINLISDVKCTHVVRKLG